MVHPPKTLQPFLWSTDTNLLDLEKDKGYIIPQILIYGRFQEIRWLFRVYRRDAVVRYFRNHPMKLYPKAMFFFIKNYLLRLDGVQLDTDDYVTSISGPIRQRAAKNI